MHAKATKIEVVRNVARTLGDLILDTVPASMTGSSLDFDILVHPISGQLKGTNLYIHTGAGQNQYRVVTDFQPTNNRLIFGEVFSSIPSINSQCWLFQHFNYPDDYSNAINRMLNKTRLMYLEEKVATMELVASQYEYIVPSGFEYISTLRMVPSGSTDYDTDDEVSRIFEIAPRFWRIEPNAKGTYVIAFDRRKINLDNFDNEWVNIVGQVLPDVHNLVATGDMPGELEEYVIQGACMILASQRINENKEWYSKFRMFKDNTDDLEAYIYRHPRGKKVG